MNTSFSHRIELMQRWRRETYTRGFRHGVIAALGAIAFFALYVYVGGGSS